MSIDKRKLKKQKKREEKLKKQKLSALNSNNQELNKTQKSFGKIQIALVIEFYQKISVFN